jgi:hypothetical protein
MEEKTQIRLPPQISLNLSEKGEIQLSGASEHLHEILDTAKYSQQIYLRHQLQMQDKHNQQAIALGFLFAMILSIITVLVINVKPQPQVSQNVRSLIY